MNTPIREVFYYNALKSFTDRAVKRMFGQRSHHPHQGRQEKARRLRQLDNGIIQQNPYAR